MRHRPNNTDKRAGHPEKIEPAQEKQAVESAAGGSRHSASERPSLEAAQVDGQEPAAVAEAASRPTGLRASEPAPAVPQALADARMEIDALKDKLLRLQADFDNFRKRTARDAALVSRRASEDIIRELLPVLDHIDLGLQRAAEHGANVAFMEGLRMISNELLGVLGKFGVTPLDPEGQVFDPSLHEAVAHTPSGDHPEGTVIRQVRRGFMLDNRVFRAPQVVVSSGEPPESAPPAEEG